MEQGGLTPRGRSNSPMDTETCHYCEQNSEFGTITYSGLESDDRFIDILSDLLDQCIGVDDQVPLIFQSSFVY